VPVKTTSKVVPILPPVGASKLKRPREGEDQERREQEQRYELFGGDEACLLALVGGERPVPLNPVVVADQHEDGHGARHVREYRHDFVHAAGPVDRMRELSKLEKSVPEQDQRQQLELLSQRACHRAGEREYEGEHLDDQQKRERDIQGGEWISGDARGERRRQRSDAIEPDRRQRAQKGDYQDNAERPVRPRVPPDTVEGVEQRGPGAEKSAHGGK